MEMRGGQHVRQWPVRLRNPIPHASASQKGVAMKRKMVRKPGPRTLRQQAWANSTRFRSMGRAMMKRFNNLRRSGPKCGAQTKIDGHPCQNPAMANGRCRVLHRRLGARSAGHLSRRQ
jgi:hypothetical protein